MPTAYIVVAHDGQPAAPFLRVEGVTGGYRYEIDRIPYETPPLKGTVKHGRGGQGYPCASSRAHAVAVADEVSSILLRVEGEPEDEAGSIAVCRQLSVLEATHGFCHPAQLEHPQVVALAASMASLLADYCPDPLLATAIEAAERYAVTRLPSARVVTSQAAEALTRRISGEPGFTGAAGPLVARDAAEAARAAAAAATAPMEGAVDLELTAWLSIAAAWLRQGEERRMAGGWAASAARKTEFAVLEAFLNTATPGQRGFGEELREQWVSWGDLLFNGMSATEFLQRRTVDAALQDILEGTLAVEYKERSQRSLKGELIPMSKADADSLDAVFAAQSRMVQAVKLTDTLAALLEERLDVNDRNKLISQCVERYGDSLPVSVIRETLSPVRLNLIIGTGWTPPYAPVGSEDFKVRWDEDAEPFQVVIQTSSGPATFQISESQTDFPLGERITVLELWVQPSTAILSRNRRYAFRLIGWG